MSIRPALQWSWRLGAKFVRGVPLATLLIVIATLGSQLAFLLASLMPLKVILLLGSPRTPEYFPAFLREMERSHLIVGLSSLAVLLFLAHLLGERVITAAASYGAERLLTSTRKLTLFENQDEVASRSYQRYARSVAALIFMLMASAVLAVIYPALALFFAGYVLLAWLVAMGLVRWSTRFRQRWLAEPARVVEGLGSLGFLAGFAGIVADNLLGASLSVLIAVLSLLLLRQMFRHLALTVGDLAGLYARKPQLDALFFREHVFTGRLARETGQGVWDLVERSERQTWLAAVLRNVADLDDVRLESSWRQTGVADVLALTVEAWRDSELVGRYLVRLFNTNRRALALHEAGLMVEGMPGLPAPHFLGADLVQGVHCHVFTDPCGQAVVPRELRTHVASLRTALMGVEPPAELVARYECSRPLLWQRLDDKLIDRLRLAVDSLEDLQLVERLSSCLAELRLRLRGLPLVIVNPDLLADSLQVTEEGRVLALYWGRWSLEPLGADWPETGEGLEAALELASRQRSELSEVNLDDVRLCALLAAVERQCQRQYYREACALLPQLLAVSESLQIASAQP